MADKCVAMQAEVDIPVVHYLWDSGWLVTHNLATGAWTSRRIPHPNEIATAPFTVPNRELAPEVADD